MNRIQCLNILILSNILIILSAYVACVFLLASVKLASVSNSFADL